MCLVNLFTKVTTLLVINQLKMMIGQLDRGATFCKVSPQVIKNWKILSRTLNTVSVKFS